MSLFRFLKQKEFRPVDDATVRFVGAELKAIACRLEKGGPRYSDLCFALVNQLRKTLLQELDHSRPTSPQEKLLRLAVNNLYDAENLPHRRAPDFLRNVSLSLEHFGETEAEARAHHEQPAREALVYREAT